MPFNDNNGPGARARELNGRFDDLINGLRQLLGHTRPNARPPYAYENASEFRLERGHRNNQKTDQKGLEENLHTYQGQALAGEAKNNRDDNAYNEDENDAAKETLSARPFEEIDNPVDY